MPKEWAERHDTSDHPDLYGFDLGEHRGITNKPWEYHGDNVENPIFRTLFCGGL